MVMCMTPTLLTASMSRSFLVGGAEPPGLDSPADAYSK